MYNKGMTYELAKELKDAGFPQAKLGTLDENKFRYYTEKDGERAFVPTLSELIEACGELDFRLHCYPHGYVIEQKGEMDMEIQPTPEEAVAKLWLALNKKILRKNLEELDPLGKLVDKISMFPPMPSHRFFWQCPSCVFKVVHEI